MDIAAGDLHRCLSLCASPAISHRCFFSPLRPLTGLSVAHNELHEVGGGPDGFKAGVDDAAVVADGPRGVLGHLGGRKGRNRRRPAGERVARQEPKKNGREKMANWS